MDAFSPIATGRFKTPATTVLPAHDFVSDPRDPANWSERAARWAVATVKSQPVRTAPVYDSHKIDGRSGIVNFKLVGRGLIVGDERLGKPVKLAGDPPLGGFELAGEDNPWYPATARIDGQRVRVTSTEIAKPVAVRYAWAPRPKQANLYNQSGIAAQPLNTDSPSSK